MINRNKRDVHGIYLELYVCFLLRSFCGAVMGILLLLTRRMKFQCAAYVVLNAIAFENLKTSLPFLCIICPIHTVSLFSDLYIQILATEAKRI